MTFKPEIPFSQIGVILITERDSVFFILLEYHTLNPHYSYDVVEPTAFATVLSFLRYCVSASPISIDLSMFLVNNNIIANDKPKLKKIKSPGTWIIPRGLKSLILHKGLLKTIKLLYWHDAHPEFAT